MAILQGFLVILFMIIKKRISKTNFFIKFRVVNVKFYFHFGNFPQNKLTGSDALYIIFFIHDVIENLKHFSIQAFVYFQFYWQIKS